MIVQIQYCLLQIVQCATIINAVIRALLAVGAGHLCRHNSFDLRLGIAVASRRALQLQRLGHIDQQRTIDNGVLEVDLTIILSTTISTL